MARWEYARLETTFGAATVNVYIHFYTPRGVHTKKEQGSEAKTLEMLARAIAGMGNDGWEIFQADGQVYHFRRQS